MRKRHAIVTPWLVRITCAVALLLVGFAHQAPSFAKGVFVPAEFADYILPDGTLPVICTAGKVDHIQTHEKAHLHGCEACRITASVLLPLPDKVGIEQVYTSTAVTRYYRTAISSWRPLPPNNGPRAPPRTSAFA